MNFYEITKDHIINEEKSFVNAGIDATAIAVKKGYKVGFLTARASLDNHKQLIRTIMVMTALRMTDKIDEFKNNLKKVRLAFTSEFYFFTNDTKDMQNKISKYLLPKMKDDGFFGNSKVRVGNDEKKAYILRLLSDIFGIKLKFFDDESKNLLTAKKLENKYKNIKSYDIAHFDQKKMKNSLSKNDKIFLFDIDGTLINAEANVWIIKANGKREGISQEEFATGNYKLELGDNLDFHEFSDRKHLTKLAREFKEIVKNKLLEKFFDMQIKIENAKMEDDKLTGMFNNKKITVRKISDNNFVISYDGTFSKGKTLNQLIQNMKKYFNNIVTESISEFKEARLLKLGLKRIDKNINDIYRHKNYFIYLNQFDEDNNFAFIKEDDTDEFFYLLTEKQLDNNKLRDINRIISYLENNKEKMQKWTSFGDMIVWLKENRHLPINESYFRDIMILEE